MNTQDGYTDQQAIDDYNTYAPGRAFAMLLGDNIVLTNEEGDVQFVDKWELWSLWNRKGEKNV